jgi:hypothetical protein
MMLFSASTSTILQSSSTGLYNQLVIYVNNVCAIESTSPSINMFISATNDPYYGHINEKIKEVTTYPKEKQNMKKKRARLFNNNQLYNIVLVASF